MNFALIELTQEYNRKFNISLHSDDPINILIEKASVYLEDDDNKSRIDNIEKERCFFEWLWERKGHALFMWIVPITNNELDFDASDEFLNTFPDHS